MSELIAGSIQYVARPQDTVMTMATSRREVMRCSFCTPPSELRREKVPFADIRPPLLVLSSLESLSVLSKSTKLVAVKMTLLNPKAHVVGSVYRVASAADADTVTTANNLKDGVCHFFSEIEPISGDSSDEAREGSTTCLDRNSFSEIRTTRAGSNPWHGIS